MMNRYCTPLRYPGGKQKLAPFVNEMLSANSIVDAHYVEPYAGGAGIAIQLLLEGRVKHVHLNDASKAVYAFWRSVRDDSAAFCERIAAASLTVEEWKRQREILSNPTKHDRLDVGFSLFYLNRCNRSGIPTGGVIGGLSQNGVWKMDARFPKNELIRRVEAISAKRRFITLRNLDAEDFLLGYVQSLPSNSFVYCDPPYFHQSHRLYLNHYKSDDHLRVGALIQRHLTHRWCVSYDNVPDVVKIYECRRSLVYGLQYNAARVYQGQEVLFVADNVKLPVGSMVKNIDLALKTQSPPLPVKATAVR